MNITSSTTSSTPSTTTVLIDSDALNESSSVTSWLHPTKHEYEIYVGHFRSVSLAAVQNMLFLLRNAKWKVAAAHGVKFDRHEQLPYFSKVADDELLPALKAIVNDVFHEADHELLRISGNATVTRLVEAKSIQEIIICLDETATLHAQALKVLECGKYTTVLPTDSPIGTPVRGLRGTLNLEQVDEALADPNPPAEDINGLLPSHFSYKIHNHPERLIVQWPAEWGSDFLKATIKAAHTLRVERRDPSFSDYIALHCAYHLLNQGNNPFTLTDARFLGQVGFRRDTQTYVSLTDPGDGHVFGTTRKSRWMRGAIVHVEHLERPQNLSRESIESYRIPSILDFARTRLHTGSAAPNTYFVGRALKDSGEFEYDFIKVVNTTSSAATAAFQLGAAECKVAMDGLKASQMVAYMRALAGHALRGHKQYFSAAYNLNHPLIDDLNPTENGNPRIITEKLEIGGRGIELAALGGFDKVTWDGASDTYPSKCIMEQLGFRDALELVHRAHSVGLVTYMSAGFKFHNIQDAVLSGVDGIGIGGAQILRYMDSISGMHGPYTEEHIDKITVARDNAANSVRGRGVHLLARLDQMFFEGSLNETELEVREVLYKALYDVDEDEIQRILTEDDAAMAIVKLPDDGEQPWIGRARRLLRHRNPILKKGLEGTPESERVWAGFIKGLKILIVEKNDIGIHAYAQSEPWKSLRNKYREAMGDVKSYQGETRILLKVTPYGGTEH